MKKEKNYKKPIIVILIILVSYLVSLFVPVISVYTRYPLYFVKCGGSPIIGEELKTRKYYIPGDKLYKLYPTAEAFFCTEQEAEENSYIKATFDTP